MDRVGRTVRHVLPLICVSVDLCLQILPLKAKNDCTTDGQGKLNRNNNNE